MKKGFLAMFSVLFLFSIVLIGISLIAVFLNINFFWILVGIWVLGILWSVVVAFGKRRADVKLRWVMFLVFVPVISLFSYIFFGREYHLSVDKEYKYLQFKNFSNASQKRNFNASEVILNTEVPQYRNAFNIGQYIQNDLAFQDSQVELLNNGSEAWIKIFEDLDKAKQYILFNYYMIGDSEIYRNLKKLLLKKAKQGVRVYLIYDFVGSLGKFNRKEHIELKKSGIMIHSYLPMTMPFLNWKSNYRDHRKDISIDGKIAYFGGTNITDEYINKSKKFGFWNDEQVRITGSAVAGIEKIFVSDWKFVTGTNLIKLEPDLGVMNKPVKSEDRLTQIVACGPNHEFSSHFEILMKLIATAEHRIWLSTPYFVPPSELLEQLKTAALSGIDVRLVLPGITDKALLLDVSERYADALFKAGVKIYSMTGTFNHTKAFLIDEEISFIGSTNLDYRALFSDQQTMGLIYSKKFNLQLEERFQWEFSVSKLNTISLAKNKSWFKRFCTILVSWASPLL